MKATQHTTPLASLHGVSKSYGSASRVTHALKAVDFEAVAGEVSLLLGPSGSGKSTLLTILAGMQRPTSGEVRLFGKQVDDYKPRILQRLRAARIGFIFQTFHLVEALTAVENIIMVLRFNGIRGREASRRAMALLEQFSIGHLANDRPLRMSQGEKQRVAVARALANEARLIIADEPTGSLASDQGMAIVKMLREASHDDSRAIVVASHDIRITKYADAVYHLRDGVLERK